MKVKGQHLIFLTFLLLAIVVAACAPAATPTPTAVPQPTQPAGQASPTAAAQPSPTAQKFKADKTFKFAYLTLGWAATEIIDKQKLLEKRGWKVEFTTVGPISGLVNTFVSGQADIIDMSAVIAGQMYEQGNKLKIFGTAVGTLGSIVVPVDSQIKDVTDLKGKKLGAIVGGTTFQDMNASMRKLYNIDLQKDTTLITANQPPDLANLLVKGDVDAINVWLPTSAQLVRTGKYKFLVTQQELWEKVSGKKDLEVHVVYLTRPDIAQQYPELLKDINDAQKEAADIWANQPEVAAQAIMAVTQLPKEDVLFAMKETKQVMWGLTDANIDTILAQLKHNREFGTLLKSDMWLNPDQKLRQDLFFIPK